MLNEVTRLLIAHRGVQDQITENTLESILLAYKLGAPYVEIDVRKTADNKLILFHDQDIYRLTGKPGLIKKTTLTKLESLKLIKGGKVTTLEELLQTIKDQDLPGLVIETKIAGVEKEIADLITKYKLYEKIIFWSFHHNAVKAFNDLLGNKVRKGFLVPFIFNNELQVINKMKESNASLIYTTFGRLNLKKFKEHGIGVVSKSNEINKAKQLLAAGVAGILTDNVSIIEKLKQI